MAYFFASDLLNPTLPALVARVSLSGAAVMPPDEVD